MRAPSRAGWVSAAAAVLAAACASLPVGDYRAALPEPLPRRVELAEVPFHPQEEYQCGPAALATALGSAGVDRRPDDLRDEVYLPRRQGSLQAEMLAATRRAGILPYRLEPDPGALLREVAAGHPVVVLQNLRFDWAPQWHYAVVVGYDLGANEIVLRSGRERRLVMAAEAFDRSWLRAGRWAFVAQPPGRLPATAREADYVAAAAALERVAPAAAETAYRTALAAWPGNLVARVGLGTTAYRRGDLAAAGAAFQQAAAEHPDAADAWNNLAQVRLEQGRRPEARVAARRAVALGGARLKTYEATQRAVEAGAAR